MNTQINIKFERENVMKKQALLFTIMFLTATASLFSELTIKPDKIREGQKVSFIYTPNEKFTAGENLYLFLYTFTYKSTNPVANEIPFRFDAMTKKYTAEFIIPQNIIYVFSNVTNGKVSDNNSGNYWDIIVSNNDGVPLKGAYLKNSVTYLGNLPTTFNREANFLKVVELLKKELELYPDNIQAEIGLTSFQYDLKMIDKSIFESKMSNLVYAKFNSDDENDVKAMSRALKIMNNKEKADKIEQEFSIKYPQSSLAEELFMARLAKAASRKEFVEGVAEYFSKYPNSQNKDRISSALIDSYMQTSAYNDLTETLKKIQNPGPGIYIKLAVLLIENKKALPDSSLEYKYGEALRLLNIARQEAIKSGNLEKPLYLSDREWKRKQEINIAAIYESFGKIYILRKDYQQAVTNYLEAMKIYGDEASPELYESIIAAFNEQAEYQKCYDFIVQSLINSKSTDEIDKLFPTIYKKLNGENSDYSNAFDSLLLIAKNNRINNLKKNMLNLKIDFGMIETINGIKIDLSILKGKVIIIEFWSTWCGPCSDVLTSLETIYNMYSENSNVLIAAVDIWEKGTNRKADVQDYVNKGEFDLPVYLDLKDELPRKLSVSGLPTRLYIDKEGIVQFKEVGFAGMDESIRSASDIIELLLQK
jgi:thiol-disulfide isomerase/thioredoxin